MSNLPPLQTAELNLIADDPLTFVEVTERFLQARIYPYLPSDTQPAAVMQKDKSIQVYVEESQEQQGGAAASRPSQSCPSELAPERTSESEPLHWNIKNCYERMLNDIVRDSDKLGIQEPAQLLQYAKVWRGYAAHVTRRRDLEMPWSQEHFVNAIRWMAEQGNGEDLALLRRVRKLPPFASDEIRRSLANAEEQIHARVYAPRAVIDREEAAYQRNRAEWDTLYAGQYIAVHFGQVIDHDVDKRLLIRRLDQQQREEGRFRAYIVQVGAPIYEARGPRAGRRAAQQET